MVAAVGGVEYMSVPKDYAELFMTYYPYVVNLVNKHGITHDNKEDVASEILTRFMERGFLDKYDPTLVFEFAGEKRPARFKNFLSGFVLTYVKGHYDKQKRIRSREVQIVDLRLFPQTGGQSPEPADTWGELYGATVDGPEEAVLDALMEQELAAGLRAYLATVPKRNSSDRCDLVALFDAVRAQCLDKGTYDIAVLKDTFGVSSTAMHTWVWWLKSHLCAALGLPLPPKRRRTTKPKPTAQP